MEIRRQKEEKEEEEEVTARKVEMESRRKEDGTDEVKTDPKHPRGET